VYVSEKKGKWEVHDSQMHYKYPHEYESASSTEHSTPEHSKSDDWESPSSPYTVHKQSVSSSQAADISHGYGHSHSMHVPKVHVKTSKKVTQLYSSEYAPMKHLPKSKHGCSPMVCQPQYVMHDCYIPREVPVIHPIIHVNRYHIVNVPTHYYQYSTQNRVVDPGCPGKPSHLPSRDF
jgi:hypothetical protein